MNRSTTDRRKTLYSSRGCKSVLLRHRWDNGRRTCGRSHQLATVVLDSSPVGDNAEGPLFAIPWNLLALQTFLILHTSASGAVMDVCEDGTIFR
jgi:hypothetical protein